jgi:hypothetical protein
VGQATDGHADEAGAAAAALNGKPNQAGPSYRKAAKATASHGNAAKAATPTSHWLWPGGEIQGTGVSEVTGKLGNRRINEHKRRIIVKKSVWEMFGHTF